MSAQAIYINTLVRLLAREYFARLFIRYAVMLDNGGRFRRSWIRLIERALDAVSGTGWIYSWDESSGNWGIYDPFEYDNFSEESL